MGEVRRGLEMPAPAALDQLDAMAFIVARELSQGDLHLALTDMLGNFLHRQRRRGGEQGRFDGAHQLVHQAAFTWIGANASS